MTPVLSLQNVVKRYHNHLAVDKVSFDIAPGVIFGLLGPNGAGKTSIIRMITSITSPDEGKILLNGEILHQFHPEKIGYMPEERGLYKKMKVGEQLIYLAQLKGLSKAIALEKIKYWFEKFKIQAWWNKKIEELSKGMQQKIQFIATVMHEPDLIILDEPFSGLDPINSNLIKDEIYELKQKGMSIIFSTHRMEQVEEICDNIVLINQGKIVLEGSVVDIKNNFKENIFKVSYKENKALHFEEDNFEVITQNDTSVRVKIHEEKSSNELLQLLLNKGVQIIDYQEELPSLNDIFIQNAGGENA